MVNYDLIVVIGVVVLVGTLTFIARKKRNGVNSTEKLSFSKKPRDLLDNLSSTVLIKYKATGRYEKAVQDVVERNLDKNAKVLLVSSPLRAEGYAKNFKEANQRDDLIIIKLSAGSKTDRFFITHGADKKKDPNDRIMEISVDWLEYLSEVIEDLPTQSTIIFEPLSDIILMNGFEKTFKFMKKSLDYCANAGLQMISFINDEAHEEKVKASFEGLFTNIASVFDDSIEIVK
jgi:CRISPR/Cas system CMR-associated protein Cmr5 small subunit